MNPYAFQDQRVAVFIDTQNIYHSAKNFYNKNIDFKNLVDIVVQERKLIRAIAYVIKSDLKEKENNFFEALKNRGIELRVKDIIYFSSGEKKANWDIGLAVDAIKISKFVDVVILISGDGDFIHLVDFLKHQGNIVEVAGFGRNTSSKLKEHADFFYDLDDFKKYIFLKK